MKNTDSIPTVLQLHCTEDIGYGPRPHYAPFDPWSEPVWDIDLTVARKGLNCDVKVNGREMEGRRPFAFKLCADVKDQTHVEVRSYALDQDGGIHKHCHEPVVKVDRLLPRRLRINGHLVFEQPTVTPATPEGK